MKNSEEKLGCLYVVATPIGNLSDITDRAKTVLAECDTVICEDTRVTKVLLDHLGLYKPLLAYHDNNELRQTPQVIDKILAGERVALVSDAGTPAISDPGFRVVRECRRQGLTVIPVPGPSALISALSASGLPTNAFFYAGFLQPKTSARQKFLTEYKDFPHTIVLYESSHRIEKFMDDIIRVLGTERVICVAREITKRFETFYVGSAAAVHEQMKNSTTKGEFVVIIASSEFIL